MIVKYVSIWLVSYLSFSDIQVDLLTRKIDETQQPDLNATYKLPYIMYVTRALTFLL